jgi:hypothetical protein
VYIITAKYNGLQVIIDKLEVSKEGIIEALWFINKKNQRQWAFPKDMEEFIIEEIN